MSRPNPRISTLLTGVLLNGVLLVCGTLEVGQLVLWLLGPLWLGSLLGVLLVLGGRQKLGARLVFIGSVPFVPLGLIAVLAARKLLDEIRRQEFGLS